MPEISRGQFIEAVKAIFLPELAEFKQSRKAIAAGWARIEARWDELHAGLAKRPDY